jgi:hypothetical protein
MKSKILLLLMTLGLLTVQAQQPAPRILENVFYPKVAPQNLVVKPIKSNETQTKGTVYATTVTPESAQKANETQATHQVNFVLDFNEESQTPSHIVLRNAETITGSQEQGVYMLESGSNILTIPDGTYDIVVDFFELDPTVPYMMPLYSLYVIREQVTINQDTTLNFAASEAKNHIHFQTLTIDGIPVNTGKIFVDEEWNFTQVEQGNTDAVICHSMICCKDYGVMASNAGRIGQAYEGAIQDEANGLFSDFFVNDVSERYAFYCYRAAINGHNIYTSAYETIGASSDITVSNDPTKFTLFEDPFLVPNQQGEERYCTFDMYIHNIFEAGNNGSEITIQDAIAEGETCKYYISAATDDSQAGFIPFIQPGASTMNRIAMIGMSMTKTDDDIFIANNGVGSYYIYNGINFNLEPSDGDFKEYPEWPTHPIFSYSVEKKIDKFGNNCSLLVSSPYQSETTYGTQTFRGMYIDFDYIGRYGEKKFNDVRSTSVNINVNGEEIYSGMGYSHINLEELISGTVDVTLTNEMMTVDGMDGANTAQLHYIAGGEDETPPTTTMLHFRDGNGNVTDRFDTASDGMLEFSAGDFNFILTPMNTAAYTRQAPDLVEVFYSPYGEDNWNELPVEEVLENYWPVMGWFYTGSLAGVTGEAYEGWFDLKVKVTDAAGNWQEQVISPAFRIDNLAYSGIAEPRSNNAHEVARYNLAGQRVDGNATGVVIVKMSDGTARKILVP